MWRKPWGYEKYMWLSNFVTVRYNFGVFFSYSNDATVCPLKFHSIYHLHFHTKSNNQKVKFMPKYSYSNIFWQRQSLDLCSWIIPLSECKIRTKTYMYMYMYEDRKIYLKHDLCVVHVYMYMCWLSYTWSVNRFSTDLKHGIWWIVSQILLHTCTWLYRVKCQIISPSVERDRERDDSVEKNHQHFNKFGLKVAGLLMFFFFFFFFFINKETILVNRHY